MPGVDVDVVSVPELSGSLVPGLEPLEPPGYGLYGSPEVSPPGG